jgi:hypothetical protein
MLDARYGRCAMQGKANARCKARHMGDASKGLHIVTAIGKATDAVYTKVLCWIFTVAMYNTFILNNN